MRRSLIAGWQAQEIDVITPTVEVELVVLGVGILAVVLAMLFHSSDVAFAGMLMTALAAYAAWLDRRT